VTAGSISGIHHITAIATDPQRTLDFYTQVLGLRLVKLTVNFDDPGTYHFYFGDDVGTPGSILTFFPWPGASAGSKGAGQVVTIAFDVSPASIDFWSKRLRDSAVSLNASEERFGERVLSFRDPDGLLLELVAVDGGADRPVPRNADVPAEHALRGFHGATLAEQTTAGTEQLLQFMGFTKIGQEANRIRYRGAAHDASIVDLTHAPDAEYGELGGGIVHHIAFRAASDGQQAEWRSDLVEHGYRVTPIIDRIYFHSIYFREPGGVLFEIATDAPGFALDETLDHLGEHLKLPPWLEASRATLERRLPVLTLPSVAK